MVGARALAVAVLLLSYGAVGARQPAVRTSVPLPAPAATLADAIGLASDDRSRLLIDIVRLVFDSPDGQNVEDARLSTTLRALVQSSKTPGEKVPLPLDPSIWRETILQQQVPDTQIIAAILGSRDLALLYHGLAALDDETLGWLGPDRETLQHVLRRSAAFAAFGRAVHVRGGRVLVPGGAEAEPLWRTLTGVDPERPAAFVQRLFRDQNGRLAFFYDTVAHLDADRQRFALGLSLPPAARVERARALLQLFHDSAPDWRIAERPFARAPLDPAVLLSVIAVDDGGVPAGPIARRLWDRVFRDDGDSDPFREIGADDILSESEIAPADASWFASRIVTSGFPLARRRLDALLFAQRMFAAPKPEAAATVATALRGFMTFPALMLTLERIGISSPARFVDAARHAAALESVEDGAAQRTAILQFQSAVTIVDRARRSGALSKDDAAALVASLVTLDVSRQDGYAGRMAAWIHDSLLRNIEPAPADAANPIEEAILAAMAGVRSGAAPPAVVEWEGRRYRVDPSAAEFRRLQRMRRRQGGATIDAALTTRPPASRDSKAGGAEKNGVERPLTEALVSIAYAAHLGDPDGQALSGGNVALRHDLGLAPMANNVRTPGAWRLPREEFGKNGWKIVGSLLGLETALGRLALRRLDASEMPSAPRLSSNERQTLALTAALINPRALSDTARDEIAASIARGRARAGALRADRAELDRLARDAGLSEWRREALGWQLTEDRERAIAQFSLLELFWLGAPRPSAVAALDAWGAAMLPLTGCLCVEMPRPRPWEEMTGRPATGQLATRGVDVALHVAETLAALRLPAALAAGVIAYASLDAVERAQPAYFDDWPAFARTILALPRERMVDYIAALAANGPLMPDVVRDAQ